jgi:hypothetical protein
MNAFENARASHASRQKGADDFVDHLEFQLVLADVKKFFFMMFLRESERSGDGLMSQAEFNKFVKRMGAWGVGADAASAYRMIENQRDVEWRGTGETTTRPSCPSDTPLRVGLSHDQLEAGACSPRSGGS